MPAPRKYPDELRERAIRLCLRNGQPVAKVAADLARLPVRGEVVHCESVASLLEEVTVKQTPVVATVA